MRVFYLFLSIACLIISINNDKKSDISLIDIFLILIFLIFILFYVIRYLKNRNDYLSIDSQQISWFDNEGNKKIVIDLNEVVNYSIIQERIKSDEYPKLININTRKKNFSIDLQKMSLLQFSEIIIDQLKSNLDPKINS
jgi:hypothetical protein